MSVVKTDQEIQVLKEHIRSLEEMLSGTTTYMMQIQEQLEASRKALYDQNQNLERLVEERTNSLKQAVVRLEKEVRGREQAQQALSVANAELNTLLYRSSHDFKGPLCSAIGLLSLMKNQSMDEEARLYMQMLHKPLQRLDNLTKTITSIAEFRQCEVKIQSVEVLSLLNRLLESLRSQWREDFPEVKLHLKGEGILKTDAYFVESILLNLLDNAFRYRVKGRAQRVDILMEPYYRSLKITVSDNGTGIPQEYQHRVFDIFFRGSELATGSGLGLYVSRLAADKLGGRIVLRSEVGKGTKVRLYLPGL